MGAQKLLAFRAKGRLISAQNFSSSSGEASHRILSNNLLCFSRNAIEKGKGFGHFHHTAYNISCAYALMKKAEPALKWLQAAADDGFPCYPLFENDPYLVVFNNSISLTSWFGVASLSRVGCTDANRARPIFIPGGHP